MIITEIIRIVDDSMLEDAELSKEQMAELQNHAQVNFTRQGSALTARAELSIGRFEAVQRYISFVASHLTVRRIIHKEFDEVDFAQADYLMLISAEEWLDGVDYKDSCAACNGQFLRIDKSQTIEKLTSNKSVVTVNGQVTVVNSTVKDAIEGQLSGATFSRFDICEEYFYLSCDNELGPLVDCENAVLGQMKVCPQCLRLVEGVVSGPLHFPAATCKESDFAFATVVDQIVYSQDAARLMMELDDSLVPSDIVKLI